MVRVLILGATGYIGLTTARTLRRSSHVVYGLARSSAKAQELAQNEVIPILGSVEDGNYLTVIDKENIDVVIDAAQTLSTGNKTVADVANIGQQRLARRGGKGPKLGYIYVSGTWVHGSGESRLNDLNPVGLENDVGCPTQAPDLVAWRPELENKILDFGNVLDVLVLRPALVYGRQCKVWSLWFEALKSAAKEQKKVVQLQCNVEAVASLVHVDEVAGALLSATEQLSKVAGSSTYPVFDVTTSRESLKSILQAAARALGFNGEIDFINPVGAVTQALNTSARLDSTRLRDVLGWKSQRMFGMLDEIEIITAAWLASRDSPIQRP